MRHNLTQPIEDYLKTIYELTAAGQRASTNQIADAMGITPASVTGMIKKLSETEPPLLEYRRHHGVILTPQGEQVALEILRHHRLLETFLYQMLGYAWDEVHKEADRLEHVISEEFEERIAAALGNPSHDPHGDPIPTPDLHLPETPTHCLADLRPGQIGRIARVTNTDLDLLRHLASLGLVPGVILHVLNYSPYDGNLTLQITGQPVPVVVGPAITRQVFVDL